MFPQVTPESAANPTVKAFKHRGHLSESKIVSPPHQVYPKVVHDFSNIVATQSVRQDTNFVFKTFNGLWGYAPFQVVLTHKESEAKELPFRRLRHRTLGTVDFQTKFFLQKALLLHTSFRPCFTTTPLCFAIPSPPSGWKEDFHLQVIEHAWRT